MSLQTKLPRPVGHLNIAYSPMSPMNFGIVAAHFHTFVYSNVKIALQALLQAATTIHVQRLEAGTASLFSNHIYFRGQRDVTHRLLPTRLRGPYREPTPRQRFVVPAGSPGNDAREHFGDWFEELKPTRRIEDSMAELPEAELSRRDEFEAADIARATRIPSVAQLDGFQRQAAAITVVRRAEYSTFQRIQKWLRFLRLAGEGPSRRSPGNWECCGPLI